MTKKKNARKWTDEELRYITESKDVKVSEVAKKLDRSESAITNARYALKHGTMKVSGKGKTKTASKQVAAKPISLEFKIENISIDQKHGRGKFSKINEQLSAVMLQLEKKGANSFFMPTQKCGSAGSGMSAVHHVKSLLRSEHKHMADCEFTTQSVKNEDGVFLGLRIWRTN